MGYQLVRISLLINLNRSLPINLDDISSTAEPARCEEVFLPVTAQLELEKVWVTLARKAREKWLQDNP
jgi:hypothetical protein